MRAPIWTIIPGRERIRERIREFLAVETYDSLQIAGGRYFFRKRLPDQEQPCIYMREGADGEDRLLIDPSERGTGKYTAVKPLRVSPDGRLLLYEVKEGGERTGTFELLEIETRKRLPDLLPRGYLRGFAFAPDGKSFYYVHEAVEAKRPFYRAAYQHLLGTPASEDREIFFAGEDEKIRLSLVSDKKRLAFFVYRFLEKTLTDIYLQPFDGATSPELIFSKIDYSLGLRLMDDKILAITDREAPNRKIVEIRLRENGEHEWIDVVPETDTPIGNWLVVGDSLFVSYMKEMIHRIFIFDLSGKKLGEMPIRSDETLRIIDGSPDSDEVLLETESFTEPIGIFRYSAKTNERTLWAKRSIPFDSKDFDYSQIWFMSKDGTRIPMYLVGRRDVLREKRQSHDHDFLRRLRGFHDAAVQHLCRFPHGARAACLPCPTSEAARSSASSGTRQRSGATVKQPSTTSCALRNGSSKRGEPLLENSASSEAPIPACSWERPSRNGRICSALSSAWFRCSTCSVITSSTTRMSGKRNLAPSKIQMTSPFSRNTLRTIRFGMAWPTPPR